MGMLRGLLAGLIGALLLCCCLCCWLFFAWRRRRRARKKRRDELDKLEALLHIADNADSERNTSPEAELDAMGEVLALAEHDGTSLDEAAEEVIEESTELPSLLSAAHATECDHRHGVKYAPAATESEKLDLLLDMLRGPRAAPIPLELLEHARAALLVDTGWLPSTDQEALALMKSYLDPHKVPAGQQVEIVEWLTNLKSQLQFETGHRLYRDVLLSAATDSDTSPTLSAGVPSGLVDMATNLFVSRHGHPPEGEVEVLTFLNTLLAEAGIGSTAPALNEAEQLSLQRMSATSASSELKAGLAERVSSQQLEDGVMAGAFLAPTLDGGLPPSHQLVGYEQEVEVLQTSFIRTAGEALAPLALLRKRVDSALEYASTTAEEHPEALTPPPVLPQPVLDAARVLFISRHGAEPADEREGLELLRATLDDSGIRRGAVELVESTRTAFSIGHGLLGEGGSEAGASGSSRNEAFERSPSSRGSRQQTSRGSEGSAPSSPLATRGCVAERQSYPMAGGLRASVVGGFNFLQGPPSLEGDLGDDAVCERVHSRRSCELDWRQAAAPRLIERSDSLGAEELQPAAAGHTLKGQRYHACDEPSVQAPSLPRASDVSAATKLQMGLRRFFGTRSVAPIHPSPPSPEATRAGRLQTLAAAWQLHGRPEITGTCTLRKGADGGGGVRAALLPLMAPDAGKFAELSCSSRHSSCGSPPHPRDMPRDSSSVRSAKASAAPSSPLMHPSRGTPVLTRLGSSNWSQQALDEAEAMNPLSPVRPPPPLMRPRGLPQVRPFVTLERRTALPAATPQRPAPRRKLSSVITSSHASSTCNSLAPRIPAPSRVAPVFVASVAPSAPAAATLSTSERPSHEA